MKELTKEEAIKVLPNFEIIHCLAGMIGADWNKEAVIAEINKADKIVITDNIFSHYLATQNGKKIRRFDIGGSLKELLK